MKNTLPGSKGDLTKNKLIEAAIYVLGTYGEHQTSFQKIADTAGVSQPLVVHYFKSRDNIFPAVLKYILDESLEITETEIKKHKTAFAKLSHYFYISLSYLRGSPQRAKLYVLFYYMSAYHDNYRKINTQLKSEAVDRIAGMLQEGIKNNEFHIDDVFGTAKVIHNSLTGLILNIFTENSENMSDKKLLSLFDDFCKKSLTNEKSKLRQKSK